MTTPSDPVFDGSNPHVMADDREPEVISLPGVGLVLTRRGLERLIDQMPPSVRQQVDALLRSSKPVEFRAPANTGRKIREVLKQIIPLIPADLPEEDSDDDYIGLKGELESVAGDWFSAPEIEMPLWIAVATSLETWLEEPKRNWPEWKWEVLAIFSGRPFSKRLVMDSLPEEK